MGGTGTVPHCAVLSSFVATIGKVSRVAAGGASFRAVTQSFEQINNIPTSPLPFNKRDLLAKGVKFVNRRVWVLTVNLYENYRRRGWKRSHPNLNCNPGSTMHNEIIDVLINKYDILTQTTENTQYLV